MAAPAPRSKKVLVENLDYGVTEQDVEVRISVFAPARVLS